MGLELLDVVTIDGPAGAGKSSVARVVANKLAYTFLDTGAMYRAIAYGAVSHNIKPSETDRMDQYLSEAQLMILPGINKMHLELNGVDVTELIRSPEMGKHASDYSILPAVRTFCSLLQRSFGEKGRIVCEGRDMGTVVFPDARWKFFLTAAVDARAKRRWLELKDKGETPDLKILQQSIEARDKQDSGRQLAPLKPADDAVIIDTTTMNFEEVTDFVCKHIASH